MQQYVPRYSIALTYFMCDATICSVFVETIITREIRDMIKILKRTGSYMDFNADKITNAIIKAMKETKDGVDEDLAKEISLNIQAELENKNFPIAVELVQDMVENELMDSKRKDVAKRYILYRYERDKSRDSRKRKDYKLLSEEFISKYKHIGSPMDHRIGLPTIHYVHSVHMSYHK